MIYDKYYSQHKGATQEMLVDFAKDIFAYGKIAGVDHHPDGYKVVQVVREGIPARYWVHIDGFRIVEIIDSIWDAGAPATGIAVKPESEGGAE